jgi:hypothetical protein
MTDDLNIYRSAKLGIDQHGEWASTCAIARAVTLLDVEDVASLIIWLRTLAAIEVVRHGPREAEAVNRGSRLTGRHPAPRRIIFSGASQWAEQMARQPPGCNRCL